MAIIGNLSAIEESIDEIQQHLLDKGAEFLRNRVSENYGRSSVEGLAPYPKHSGLTSDLHGSHPLFNLTGSGIDSIKTSKTTDREKRKIHTTHRGLFINEYGSSQVVTERQAKYLASQGVPVRVGTELVQPARPVFKDTVESPFTKNDMVNYLKSL